MLRLVHPLTVPAALAAVLVLAACGGGDGGSGLATLVDTATTAAPVEVERVEVQSDDLAAAESATATTGTDVTDAEGQADGLGEAATSVSENAVGGTEGSAEDAVSATADFSEDAVSATAGSSVEDAASGSVGSVEESAASAAADLTYEERLLEFGECMRENGIDFPDPVVEADGTVTFGFRPGGGGGSGALQRLREIGRDPDLPAAREACEHLLEGLAFGPGSGNFDLTEFQDRLLEFAQCMRDNGVDVGDPDLRNFGPGADDDGAPGGPFGGIDFQDPDVAAAFSTCQQQVSLGAPRFGGDR